MPDSRFPEPTAEQIEAAARLVPLSVEGEPIQSKYASIMVGCGDGRINRRKVGAICGDDIEALFHPQTLRELDRICLMPDGETINLKARNIFRFNWLKIYTPGPAGGRYSSDTLGFLVTAHNADIRVLNIIMTQHDGCAAEAAGTRLSWEEAIRLTLADLHSMELPYSVKLYFGDVTTNGSQMTPLRLACTYDPAEYSEMLAKMQPHDVLLPTEDCSAAFPSDVSLLHPTRSPAERCRQRMLASKR